MAQKAIEFKRKGPQLLLEYSPRDDDTWVHAKFARGEELVVKGTYHLRQAHLFEEAPPNENQYGGEPLLFVIAELKGKYYVFDEEILPVGCKILIHASTPIDWKWFTAEKKVSIFGVIAQLGLNRIVIGGQEKDAIPISEFQKLIHQFPTPIELKRYVQARVSSVVREYTETKDDAEKKYERYLDRRIKRPAKNLIGEFRENEVQKYRKLLKRLRTMLASEQTYSEAVWQQEILQIFLLLYPKYIKAIKEARIRDTDNAATKKIDILLVDASGNIDIVEIKKPFGKCIVTDGRYRDNHIPLRELSGTVMQIEKYIFCLNRWGVNGEKALTAKYKSDFPQGFSIKVTNPCGVIIMGRDSGLSAAQNRDFEVVKRKYKNVVDIITYDDLLRRLEAVIKHFSRS